MRANVAYVLHVPYRKWRSTLMWFIPCIHHETKLCTLENHLFELFFFLFIFFCLILFSFPKKKNYYKLHCRCIIWTWQKHKFQHNSNILWFIWSIYSKFTLNTKIIGVFLCSTHLRSASLSLSFTRFVCAIGTQT